MDLEGEGVAAILGRPGVPLLAEALQLEPHQAGKHPDREAVLPGAVGVDDVANVVGFADVHRAAGRPDQPGR